VNPYQQFVDEFVELFDRARQFPLGVQNIEQPSMASPNVRTKVLIFSPHPDDECIIGALPLRLKREAGATVVNIAVTQGSNVSRQQARLLELQKACEYIGFSLEQTAPSGLEKVNLQQRAADPKVWSNSVNVIAQLLEKHRPQAIFYPHANDWNSTHIGTHWLVMDALHSLSDSFQCDVIETEFWGQMSNPNLMVESSKEDVATLVAGTSFHIGEVTRNAFHLYLPAWMQDNVRRGAEIVGGQGQASPNFHFATLYRVSHWHDKERVPKWSAGRMLSRQENAGALLG